MPPRRVIVTGNPAAGAGRAGAVLARTERALGDWGAPVVTLVGDDASHARFILAQELTRDDVLVAVGGDGTVNLALDAAVTACVPLGVIPAGTGNDIAHELGIARVDDALAAVRAGLGGAPRRRVDVARLRAGERTAHYGAVLAAGFDAVVNERANARRFPRGRARYAVAVLAELAAFRPISYRITLDGVVEERASTLVCVGNGPSYGGGIRVVPSARIDDGLLHVLVVDPISRRELLRVAPRAYRGAHLGHPAVHVHTATTVRIEALDAPVVGYADGERVAPLPLEVRVLPGALEVLAPPGSG